MSNYCSVCCLLLKLLVALIFLVSLEALVNWNIRNFLNVCTFFFNNSFYFFEYIFCSQVIPLVLSAKTLFWGGRGGMGAWGWGGERGLVQTWSHCPACRRVQLLKQKAAVGSVPLMENTVWALLVYLSLLLWRCGQCFWNQCRKTVSLLKIDAGNYTIATNVSYKELTTLTLVLWLKYSL